MSESAEKSSDLSALTEVPSSDSDPSNAAAQPRTAKGVHFGDAPPDEHRGKTSLSAQRLTPSQRAALVHQFTANLDSCSPFMHTAKAAQIESVLSEILIMCQDIAAQILEPGMDKEFGEMLSVGAYHLGVLIPDDQVDVVYVVPLHMTLPETHAMMQEKLEAMESEVEDICPAGTDGLLAAPGLEFKLRGIHIKLLFSHCIPDLPPPYGETVVWHTAGVLAHEVAEKLLVSVPDVTMFRDLLRFVRHWAKQRGIYGSYFGFMGGTAWAICVARICQMYPQADLAQLTARFFRVLSRWNWQEPLGLLPGCGSGQHVPTVPVPGESGSDANISVLLPVDNPVSATPNLTVTTTKISQRELQHGFLRTQQVELVRAQWEHVSSSPPFFQRYRHYLELNFMASSPAVFASWQSWGRQQTQNLVQLFENTCSKVVTLRPWPACVDFKDASWPYACALFIGLQIERNGNDQNEGGKRCIDLREPIVRLLEAVSSWPDAGKNANQFELLIRHIRLADLKQWMENRSKGIEARSNISRRDDKGVVPMEVSWEFQ